MKGHDWTEISEALCVDIEREDDEAIANDTVEAMMASISNDGTLADAVALIREYLTALVEETKNLDYNSPVWEGLLRVDTTERGGQETLIKMTCLLLRAMWS